MKTIVIAGGGTGGHMFPGLAVAHELEKTGVRLLWLGAARGLEATRVPQANIPIHLLGVTGAVGQSCLAQLAAAARVVPATWQAATLLLRYDAAAVLAVGGYAALPGACAAGLIGVPVVLQEQNALPGVTNRLLAPWSVAIGCGFEGAVARFPSLPARWTGNPVRSEFFNLPTAPIQPVTLLILGGSQGSRFLNERVPAALALLQQKTSLPRIIHQSGSRFESEVRERYQSVGVHADIVGFLEKPSEFLAQATLVVARAGALTVCELAAARRAALLVPFAAAAHDHQTHNARAFVATGAAELFTEGEASPEKLAEALATLLANPERLVERGQKGAVLARPDAARTVADLVLRAAGQVTHEPAADAHGDRG